MSSEMMTLITFYFAIAIAIANWTFELDMVALIVFVMVFACPYCLGYYRRSSEMKKKLHVLNERKDMFDETVRNSKETFDKRKIEYTQIRKKQCSENLTTNEMSFLKKWPKVKKARLTQIHEEAEMYMGMYEEYCHIHNIPCKWSSAKTVDDSRKMFDKFVKSKGYTMANVLLGIGLGNNGQNNNSVIALVEYFMKLPATNYIIQYDGDNFSGEEFDKNAIVRNIADVARYMCNSLGNSLGNYMYMRFAASAFNTLMSFEEFRWKHGDAHHIEICPGAFDEDGEVVYGGKGTHIFEAKYQEDSLATVFVCGAGLIGLGEAAHAYALRYRMFVVSAEQLRGGKVVETDVYTLVGKPGWKNGTVADVGRGDGGCYEDNYGH